MAYQIYLVRHGRTWYNEYQKMQGWSDTPLTNDGVEVAQKAAESLKNVNFAAALTSDMKRAVDTCRIITRRNRNDLVPQELSEFREQFYGFYEGRGIDESWFVIGKPHHAKSFAQIVHNYGFDATMDFVKEADPLHDAEDATEYWNRIERGFKKIDQIAKDGDKILLVTHSITILGLAYRYKAGDFELNDVPANASLTMLERDNGVNRVTKYNQSLL
ncbi:histidine phosphatase family protein [Companilactobacillus kimchii]|uniref:Phosphoglycerate mutase n=2 Tax=Companilactobacillus kimchii TaxID=2801452 RepID=A0ABR5NVC2_9LACO|nr:histidine phosphatase family protein [Companilactobacillus kimchii]KAE9558139.1 fructose-2,6-bisphosphatase [Companilactobacillus kimchii]KRK52826.1 phosphoglycerate mutase [Companilactobacillus kimchii DSM 13961 = JCM 10707]OWF32953.1 Phosphoglycerate mutase (2,3-diphosphoglycerate-independent) [Companilactobacillus kimchii]GEO46912.1 phosphoglycerate mutase [Companilactobacillus paralimentarius]